jgi:uncharacterized protein (TIGR02594 family)
MYRPNSPWAPPWLVLALAEFGVAEIPGVQSNPKIEGYHAHTAAGKADEVVPWCASFVGAMLERSGLPSTNSKAADSYATYGEESQIRLGAIGLFGKTDPDAKGTGHVGIIAGWDDRCVLLAGGNQRNRVGFDPRPIKALVACRWPKGFVWP